MKGIIEYVDEQETIGFQKLLKLNDKYKWFKELKENPQFSKIDVKGVDVYGRDVLIEIKDRDISSDKYDTIFLETHKLDLFQQWTEDYKVLYINFFNDGVVMVWDLENIDSNELSIFEGKVTMSATGKTIQNAKRYKLPYKLACFTSTYI